jgi:beta-lactam-binding protein with PASTA domain
MKIAIVVGLGWLALGCSLIKTSSGSTTPESSGGTATTTPTSSAPDALFMPSMTRYTRPAAESLLRDKGFTGAINATGDVDPAYERDEIVCDQPPFGKYAPSVTITIKYCNTYVATNNGPMLVGLSVEDAKKRAVAAGFTGRIDVMELSEYDASCKAGNVCRADPVRWYLNQDHAMTLLVNKKLTISTPD